MPRVSILLTCYNHIQYLPTAWQNIKDQTFTDYEIIAIDDGSTDGTREWLAQQSGATIILNEKNLGTYGTLNVALNKAQGEFIAIFNDDDVWAPNKLEQQVAMMDANPKIGLVHTDGYFIDGAGRERHDSPLGFAFPKTETGDILLALVYANSIIASAVLVRRECFEKVGCFNDEYFGSGDWEMWFRICEHWHAGFVSEPLTLYRVHGSNASHKLEKIWRDDEKLREWIHERLDQYARRFSETELKNAKAHNLACLGTVKVLNGKPAEGRDFYLKSLNIDPTRWKSRIRILASFLPRKLFRKLI